MKISTEINSITRLVGSDEKAVELVGKAGFDAWDFSLFDMINVKDWSTHEFEKTDHPLNGPGYLEYARNLKRIGKEYGMVCNQSHAPFPTHLEGMCDYYLKRAIECTAEAGGKICIVHPMNSASVEENAQMYIKLLEFAKDYGVKLAAENMYNWNVEENHAAPAACSDPESFLAHLNAVNNPNLVACLDIGHASMEGLNTSPEEMILALGSHLQALHIHDVDLHDDNHQIPFSLKVDFESVVNALVKIDYKGYFTLEACNYLNTFKADDAFKGVKDLASSARKLADMFEN